MAPKGKYDATARTKDLVPSEFEVDGKTFHVKRSGSAFKKLIALDTDGTKADDPTANIDLMYEGISFVLIDPERDPEISKEDDKGVWRPKSEWLEENVDFDVAEEFMISILPTRGRDEVAPSVPSSVES